MAAGKRYKRFAGPSVNNAGYHNENWDKFFDGNALHDVAYDSLAEAITYIGNSASKTLFITTQHRITSNTIIPSNISVVVLKGGSFDVATGATLTLPLPIAERFRWIYWSGTGRVRFSKGPGGKVFPEWWGAVPEATNGTTDSAAAIQAASDAARAGEMELSYGYGTYHISSGITVSDDGAPIRWRGQGKYYTYLMATSGSSFSVMLSLTDTDNAVTALTYTNYAARSLIEGLSFEGGGVHDASTGSISTSARAQYGIKGITNHLTLRNLRVKGTGTAAIDIGCGWNIFYDDVETSNNQGDGIRSNRCANNNGLAFSHVSSFSNIGYGIRVKDGVGVDIYGGGALELNRKGAVFLECNVDAYNIHGMYFESNGGAGHVWDMPYLVGAGANATYLSGITASTVQTQGQGALTDNANVIGTCANANDVVTLSSSLLVQYVENAGAQTLQVYPSSGQQINALAVNASITIAAGSHLTFRRSSAAVAWASDSTAMAAERTTHADIIINGSTQPTEVSNALPCGGVITGNSISPGPADYFVYGPGQRGIVLEGNILNSGSECALFGTYGNHSPISPEFSYTSVNNIRIGVNPGWGTSVAPYFDIAPLGYEIIRATVTNTFISGTSQVNAVQADMGRWALQTAVSGGTFSRSSTVFPQDTAADVFGLVLGTTGESDAFGVADINVADFEQLQGKWVTASVWMKHTDIADVTGVLRISSNVFSSRQIEMDFGTSAGWQRVTAIFKFPTSGQVTFDVQKIEQNAGNIGSIFVTMPILCEFGADFQQIQSRTTLRGKVLVGSGVSVASANDLTLGAGSLFDVTGNTQLNRITKTGWPDGVPLILHFTGTPTIAHQGAANSSTLGRLNLSGSANLVATAGTQLMIYKRSGEWFEMARTLP